MIYTHYDTSAFSEISLNECIKCCYSPLVHIQQPALSLHLYIQQPALSLHLYIQQPALSLHLYIQQPALSLHLYIQQPALSLHLYIQQPALSLHLYIQQPALSLHLYIQQPALSLHSHQLTNSPSYYNLFHSVCDTQSEVNLKSGQLLHKHDLTDSHTPSPPFQQLKGLKMADSRGVSRIPEE
ncbi:hypothetical protein EB796_014682 [Bugula neritina]|uniref:Uncharacterized protein n=1 Tax=Bugula neritina TaxID=10212 RepID=A0A7J7JKX8_BUGNE|nr:hypothetical protein EB796_014682 [Bugula neritina]